MAFRAQLGRTTLVLSRGLSRVMVARTAARPRPFLRGATRDAHRLLGERWEVATAYAMTILGAVSLRGGRPAEALARLERARSIDESFGMRTHAIATTRTIGAVLGGAPGAEQVAEADEHLIQRGIKSPARFSQMLVS